MLTRSFGMYTFTTGPAWTNASHNISSVTCAKVRDGSVSRERGGDAIDPEGFSNPGRDFGFRLATHLRI